MEKRKCSLEYGDEKKNEKKIIKPIFELLKKTKNCLKLQLMCSNIADMIRGKEKVFDH